MLISHSQILIISHSQFTSFLGTLNPKPLARLAIIEKLEESQVINRNLNWLTENLNRQFLSSELNVFIVFQQCLLFCKSIIESVFTVNKRVLITSSKNRFRNRITRFTVHNIFHCVFYSKLNHMSHSRFAVNRN